MDEIVKQTLLYFFRLVTFGKRCNEFQSFPTIVEDNGTLNGFYWLLFSLVDLAVCTVYQRFPAFRLRPKWTAKVLLVMEYQYYECN